jgi:hypothetical protein
MLYEGTMYRGKLWRVKKLWDQADKLSSMTASCVIKLESCAARKQALQQEGKLYMTKVSYAITLEICAIRQKAVWPNWQAVQYEQAVQLSWNAVQYESNLCNQAGKLYITI